MTDPDSLRGMAARGATAEQVVAYLMTSAEQMQAATEAMTASTARHAGLSDLPKQIAAIKADVEALGRYVHRLDARLEQTSVQARDAAAAAAANAADIDAERTAHIEEVARVAATEAAIAAVRTELAELSRRLQVLGRKIGGRYGWRGWLALAAVVWPDARHLVIDVLSAMLAQVEMWFVTGGSNG